MSRDDLVNRGDLGSSGGLLSRGDPVTAVGPWSTHGLWSTGAHGRYGGPVEEDVPESEDAQQTGAVHLRGSCLHMVTYHWMMCCNLVEGPSVGTRHGLGTWPSELDGASAAAAKTEIETGPERWRTAGIGSGDAAAHDAVEEIINEESLLTRGGLKAATTAETRGIYNTGLLKSVVFLLLFLKEICRTLCGRLKITSKLELSRRHGCSSFTIRTAD